MISSYNSSSSRKSSSSSSSDSSQEEGQEMEIELNTNSSQDVYQMYQDNVGKEKYKNSKVSYESLEKAILITNISKMKFMLRSYFYL